MTTVMRGRKPVRGIAPIFAVLVVVALIVLGAIAWHEGGPQPLRNVVEPLAVPNGAPGSDAAQSNAAQSNAAQSNAAQGASK